MRKRRCTISCLVLIALVAGLLGGPTQARAAASRSLQEVMADVQTAIGQYHALKISPDSLTNPAQRDAVAPQAIPILQHLDALRKELAGMGGQGSAVAGEMGRQFEQFLIVFGDPNAIAHAKADAAGSDPDKVAAAKQDLLFADWIQKPSESDQTSLLDKAQAMAKDRPTDMPLGQLLASMSQFGAATPQLSQRAREIAAGMQTPIAAQLQAEAAADAKIHSFVGKPLVIAGQTVDGKPFSTADWKGKVILVDFWATWCGPCRAELPRVVKAYADYHAKGLEVLGVSNDFDAKTLTSFVADNPGMPWPQLFDPAAAAQQQWNPTTLGFGINGIPCMFLIDRSGTLASVDARENLEQQIPKMLGDSMPDNKTPENKTPENKTAGQ